MQQRRFGLNPLGCRAHRAQRSRSQRHVLEADLLFGGEPGDPADGGSVVAVVAGTRQQRGQLERVFEGDGAELAGKVEREQDVAAFDGSLEGAVC